MPLSVHRTLWDVRQWMIELRSLGKWYGRHGALLDVSLRVDHGERVGIVGANGAGKTTLLRLLAGTLSPTCGEMTIYGGDAVRHRERITGLMGFLPETAPVYDDLTIREFLKYLLVLRRVPSSSWGTLVDVALHAADLTTLVDRRIGALSFGQRKRVGIAQALVHRPKLLLLDEPGAGLDPVQLKQLRETLMRLHSVTLLISSHLLGEVEEICDRVLMLHQGRIVEDVRLSVSETPLSARILKVAMGGSARCA